MSMRLILYVGLGSAIGGITRFVLSSAIQNRSASFPVGTLVINISGSFLLGFLLRYALATPEISAEMRALLTTGFCGGYTTFSTYSYESAMMIETADYGRATIYVVASVVFALAGMFVGFLAARELIAFRQQV